MPELNYTEKGLRKKAVIQFNFDNIFEMTEKYENVKLYDMFLFNNGDFESYYKMDNSFDSVFNSARPISNKR